MRTRSYGDAALLFEMDSAGGPDPTAEVVAFAAAVRRMRTHRRDVVDAHGDGHGDPHGGSGALGQAVIDVVPAARTVLVRVRPGTDLVALERMLTGLATDSDPGSEAVASAEVVIPVIYDGADLADVAALTGLGPDQVIAAHIASRWVVGFCGFAPGFAYLTGGDPRLIVPRLDRPRTRVPQGSVALAGPYSAVYPGDSPGGWRLIGRTDAPVWNLDRTPPALLSPGVRVRFEVAGDRGAERAADERSREEEMRQRDMSGEPYLDVLEPGLLATVQDRGRPGRADIGVSPSGAADRAALARANRLVGNRPGAAGVEATFGGLVVRAGADLIVAVTGAPVRTEVDGRPVGGNATVRLRRGATLRLGRPALGLRSYLAVRGGIDVEPVLGSRSRDVLAGLGPPALSRGDRLAVGPPRGRLPAIDVVPLADPPVGDAVLRCSPGPRADWITAGALADLATTTWVVTSDLNRVGVRLDGPALELVDDRQLPSEGLVRGAIQVPGSGLPLIFLADHPTTGGYPVVAVVDDVDTDRLAQLRPGDTVRLRLPSPPDDVAPRTHAPRPNPRGPAGQSLI